MNKKRGRPKTKVLPQAESDYMTVKEVADLLKISLSHLYTLTSNKKIPHIKFLRKKLLFDRKEINEWLKSKRVYDK